MKSLFVLILAIGFPFGIFAQPDPNPDPDVTDTPIDAGLSILVVAGVAYGAKKIHDRKKEKKQKMDLNEQE